MGNHLTPNTPGKCYSPLRGRVVIFEPLFFFSILGHAAWPLTFCLRLDEATNGSREMLDEIGYSIWHAVRQFIFILSHLAFYAFLLVMLPGFLYWLVTGHTN